jgi:hypothetical protein
MPTKFQIHDEADARAELATIAADCAALEKVLGQRAPARPAGIAGLTASEAIAGEQVLDVLDGLTARRAALRVITRMELGQEANRSRPQPHPAPKPSEPMPAPPARPNGGTVSLTEQCRIANAPRIAAEEAERAKARGVLDKLDNDRQAALDARKAAAIAAAAEHRRLNPTMTELCQRAKAGQS